MGTRLCSTVSRVSSLNVHSLPQDWFNSCLKQAVMELTNHSHVGGTSSPTVMVTTDGGGMSMFATRSGAELDEDCIEQERQALNLTA